MFYSFPFQEAFTNAILLTSQFSPTILHKVTLVVTILAIEFELFLLLRILLLTRSRLTFAFSIGREYTIVDIMEGFQLQTLHKKQFFQY